MMFLVLKGEYRVCFGSEVFFYVFEVGFIGRKCIWMLIVVLEENIYFYWVIFVVYKFLFLICLIFAEGGDLWVVGIFGNVWFIVFGKVIKFVFLLGGGVVWVIDVGF